jgi:hypothetical protein
MLSLADSLPTSGWTGAEAPAGPRPGVSETRTVAYGKLDAAIRRYLPGHALSIDHQPDPLPCPEKILRGRHLCWTSRFDCSSAGKIRPAGISGRVDSADLVKISWASRFGMYSRGCSAPAQRAHQGTTIDLPADHGAREAGVHPGRLRSSCPPPRETGAFGRRRLANVPPDRIAG